MSAVRQRGPRSQQRGNGRKERLPLREDDQPRGPSGAKTLPDLFVFLYVLLVALLTAAAIHSYWRLPEPTVHGGPNEFSAVRARKHLEDITGLGIRHVGSEANEFLARDMILQKIDEIRAIASTEVEIEVSVQQPSGSFFLDFLGGFTNVYSNVTNIAVRFSKKGSSPEHAFLINAHYDSALGTVAASDDAVSCATMLEVLQCLAAEPSPELPNHAVIFLFNGAEETILQASHGFITQHPWAKQIRAFLNLEAAGAGGKEVVFQTGPDNPWLVRAYANAAPHPFWSVTAQEIFQSGIIPSDTDFRIFRDYGHVPGIDIAYFVNGYVYHTEFDEPSRIPNGCIQRAGDNVLAVVRNVMHSPFLADPGADKHGKVVFYDVFGLFSVVYPERIALIINTICSVASLVNIYFAVSRTDRTRSVKPTFVMVLLSLGVLLLSWLAAWGAAILTAVTLQLTGHSLSWFSTPTLILLIYVTPSFLAMATVHELWRHRYPTASQPALEQSSFLAAQLLWTVCLTVCSHLRLCSAFAFLLWVGFPLIFKGFLWEFVAKKAIDKTKHLTLYNLLFVVLSVLGISLPFVLTVILSISIADMFIPLMGRSGGLAPPDVIIGGITAVLVTLLSTYLLCVVVYVSSSRLKLVVGTALFLTFALTVALVVSGYVFPYSGGEPPRPKRLYLQHTDRVFYNRDGTVRQADSQVFINTFDFLQLKPIADAVPRLREAQVTRCEGVYCGEPFYVPVKHLVGEGWYLPAPKLQGIDRAELKLLSVDKTSDTRRNYTFEAKFPVRATMYIDPRDRHHMVSWSLEDTVPPTTPCGQEEQCYFVFYARGQGEGRDTFWVEIEGPAESEHFLDIAIATHHLDPPLSETALLSELLRSLPDWVTTVAWTSTYTSWEF